MTKKDAHLFLPLVQALVDGKTLQAKDITGEWSDLLNVTLAGEPQHYRIKPEPRRWKAWIDGAGFLHRPISNSVPQGWTQIEVTEILPENKQ